MPVLEKQLPQLGGSDHSEPFALGTKLLPMAAARLGDIYVSVMRAVGNRDYTGEEISPALVVDFLHDVLEHRAGWTLPGEAYALALQVVLEPWISGDIIDVPGLLEADFDSLAKDGSAKWRTFMSGLIREILATSRQLFNGTPLDIEKLQNSIFAEGGWLNDSVLGGWPSVDVRARSSALAQAKELLANGREPEAIRMLHDQLTIIRQVLEANLERGISSRELQAHAASLVLIGSCNGIDHPQDLMHVLRFASLEPARSLLIPFQALPSTMRRMLITDDPASNSQPEVEELTGGWFAFQFLVVPAWSGRANTKM